jgi:hypothetical protein
LDRLDVGHGRQHGRKRLAAAVADVLVLCAEAAEEEGGEGGTEARGRGIVLILVLVAVVVTFG